MWGNRVVIKLQLFLHTTCMDASVVELHVIGQVSKSPLSELDKVQLQPV